MPTESRKSELWSIDDVAHLLNQVVDVRANSRHADELIDEISHLLWAVGSLDPEAERLLKHSDYMNNLADGAQS